MIPPGGTRGLSRPDVGIRQSLRFRMDRSRGGDGGQRLGGRVRALDTPATGLPDPEGEAASAGLADPGSWPAILHGFMFFP